MKIYTALMMDGVGYPESTLALYGTFTTPAAAKAAIEAGSSWEVFREDYPALTWNEDGEGGYFAQDEDPTFIFLVVAHDLDVSASFSIEV